MYVVAHRQLLDKILGAQPRELNTKILWGVLGSGKTSLLHYVDGNVERGDVARIMCSNFDPGHHGELAHSASLGAVQGSFQQFARILRRIMVDVSGSDNAARIDQLVHETRQSEIYEARIPAFEDNLKKVNEPIHPAPSLPKTVLRARASGSRPPAFA